jgi:peptidoglycan hydrolase FlgJ
MQAISSSTITNNVMVNGRPDPSFAEALKKVSPDVQSKLKSKSEDFEAVFLNTMFAQMTAGLKGEGPYGETPGTGAWRSMLTDQYARGFAHAGGIGIGNEVYRSLIIQQANHAA